MVNEERAGEHCTSIMIGQIDHFENQTKKIRIGFVRPILCVQSSLLSQKCEDILLERIF